MSLIQRQLEQSGFSYTKAEANLTFNQKLEVVFDTRELASRIAKQHRTVLFKTGRYAMRTMRSLIGKKAPKDKTRVPPKRKFKKNGELTRQYQRYLDNVKKDAAKKGASRPPYKKVGTLHRLTAFSVDLEDSSVVAGPTLFRSGRVKPTDKSSGAQLLDEGGTARVRIKDANGNVTFVIRKYRSFPFREPTFKKTVPAFTRFMEDAEL